MASTAARWITGIDELQLTLEDWKSKYSALEEAYKRVLDEKSTLAAQILQYGENPQVAFDKIKELEDELKKYKDQLADCPDVDIFQWSLMTLN